jgi:hypothetical protein
VFLIVVSALSIGSTNTTTSLGAADAATSSELVRARTTARVSAPKNCPYARLGLSYYRSRYVHWTIQRDGSIPGWRKPRNCADARYLANVWAERSYASRLKTRKHMRELAQRTLRDFDADPGNRAWHRAVKEVQRAYPGTESWLMSCSASEGGHGRWVPNSQGSGVGGWLQFMPGTWSGFFRHAHAEVSARGFRVPSSAASWYSPLGQALAGAWGITHGMRHHWVGAGCH